MKMSEQEAADAGVRVTIKIPQSLRHELLEWQHAQRIQSLSAAIRVLLIAGMAAAAPPKGKNP